MSIVTNPVEQFFDLDGSPLDGGYIYLGQVANNPETNPISAYWDKDFTIPAPQPIRTINGYPSRTGTPATIYTVSDCSILVRNRRKIQVFYAPTSTNSEFSQNISNRTENTQINASDNGKTIIARGTFTQTFDASNLLGNGFAITYINAGDGIITFDPNLSELIDGDNLETIPPGESCTITCDGLGLRTQGMDARMSIRQINTALAATGTAPDFSIAPKYQIFSYFENMRFQVTFPVSGGVDNTLNVSGLGAKAIKYYTGGGGKRSAKIFAGQRAEIIYDGVDFVILNPVLSNAGEYFQLSGWSDPDDGLATNGAAVSRTTYARLYDEYCVKPGFTQQPVTITIANPGVFNHVAHNLPAGGRVRLFTTGTLPTGLGTVLDYFVNVVDANNFTLSLTPGGTPIVTTGTQSGIHTYLQSLYGLGDGSTTFNIPSLPDGWVIANSSSTSSLGARSVGDNLAHAHQYTRPGGSPASFAGTAASDGASTSTTALSGGPANLAASIKARTYVRF